MIIINRHHSYPSPFFQSIDLNWITKLEFGCWAWKHSLLNEICLYIRIDFTYLDVLLKHIPMPASSWHFVLSSNHYLMKPRCFYIIQSSATHFSFFLTTLFCYTDVPLSEIIFMVITVFAYLIKLWALTTYVYQLLLNRLLFS